MMADLFDIAEARRQRDAGLALVESNASDDFMAMAIAFVATMRGEFMGEDIRKVCLHNGISPHSPNAWGAVVRTAIRLGMIEPTGRYDVPKGVKSHGCRKPVYRSLVE